MTNAIDFSYLDTAFTLNIDENVLSRAVRVKNTVKDKIKRIFDANVIGFINNEGVNNEEKVSLKNNSDVNEQKSLLDLSEEMLSVIAHKLDILQKQERVPCVSNRAVLFTSALVSKIRTVTGKWYPETSVNEEENTLSNEVNSIHITNNLGGEVIPGMWNVDFNMNNEEESNNLGSESDSVVPQIEIPSFESQPEVELEVTPEVSNSEMVTQPPVIEYNNENDDIYSFVPNIESEISTVEPYNYEQMVQNDEIVPEPQELNDISNDDYVSEPISIPINEQKEEPIESAHDQVTELENKVAEEQKEEEKIVRPTLISIEDKISQLLHGKSNSTTIEQSTNKIVNEVRQIEKPEVSQTHVMARLRRLLNEMAEKEETIKKLSKKNKSISDEMAQFKDKIRGYEAVVSDLTARNDSLLKENEKLTTKVQEAQSSYQTTILKLEAQVEDLTKLKTEESESSKTVIADLKQKHAEEVAEIREKHAAEIKTLSESKDRQIQAIYSTISEVLGDSSRDDDFGRGLAA